jgi:protein-arginine kinase activator protein McsA
MFCDDCAVEPAEIDHLDLTLAEGQLKRLCRVCAESERQRWAAERGGAPGGPGAGPVASSQAA